MLFDAHLGDSLATFTYIDPAIIANVNPPGNVRCEPEPVLGPVQHCEWLQFRDGWCDLYRRFQEKVPSRTSDTKRRPR